MTAMTKSISVRWVALALALLTLLVYWPVREHGYVSYDDPEYVTGNLIVQSGLTWPGVKWAFTTGWTSYWHPLTWLSHMADAELFGAGPAGPHLVNVVLHVVNTLLLLGLLRRMTGSLWRSAWVAAIFALHPLHVESVAWVSERKDVLSAFFFLLTLWSYVTYVERVRAGAPAKRWYGAALLLFCGGLMSKPMVVTLPCVLLLLDYWPLRRFDAHSLRELAAGFGRKFREKVPFFALTVACSVLTFWVQKQNGAVHSLSSVSIAARIENALVAYATYLGRTIWPDDLAVFYPHPGQWSAVTVAVSALVVIGVSIALLWFARRFRFATIGWLWFLGILVPTIGLVQVGDQAMADRYTYVPMIGLLVVVAWGAAELAQRGRAARIACSVAAAVTIAACMARTRDQLSHWRNSETLFRHAIAVTKNNFVAHNNLGNTLLEQGQIEAAIAEYETTLRIRPDYAPPHNNLGMALLNLGRVDEAIPHLQRALEAQPGFAEIHNNLGHALRRKGGLDEAIRHYERAIELRPALAVAHYNLGSILLEHGRPERAAPHLFRALEIEPDDANARSELGFALLQLGQLPEAVSHLEAALRIEPDFAEPRYHLAIALFQDGRAGPAIPHFEKALERHPRNAEILNNLGWALFQENRIDEAIGRFRLALEVHPDLALAHSNLAVAFLRKGEGREAVKHYRALLALQPEHPHALSDLAWVLATWPDAAVRDSAQAMELAQRANRLSGGQDPLVLRSLAAAYAESGRFSEAVASARSALDLAVAASDIALGEVLRAQISVYEAGQPLRETPPQI